MQRRRGGHAAPLFFHTSPFFFSSLSSYFHVLVGCSLPTLSRSHFNLPPFIAASTNGALNWVHFSSLHSFNSAHRNIQTSGWASPNFRALMGYSYAAYSKPQEMASSYASYFRTAGLLHLPVARPTPSVFFLLFSSRVTNLIGKNFCLKAPSIADKVFFFFFFYVFSPTSFVPFQW